VKKLEDEVSRLQRELDRPREDSAARVLANKLQSQVRLQSHTEVLGRTLGRHCTVYVHCAAFTTGGLPGC
jgi:hypothetical protein